MNEHPGPDMKIILISPKMNLRPMDSEFKRLMSPPLGLLTLAALTPHGHDIRIADENTHDMNMHDQADLVGITVNVDTSSRAYQLASHFKKRGIPVILGGIHVSANPEEALRHADSVCIGEAENVWADILANRETGGLKKIYKSDDPVNPRRIPLPARNLISSSKYLYTNIMYTSRGCPFKCDFCYNSCDYITNRHRNRPTNQIIDEIKSFHTRQVMFIDDNFIGNIPWTADFLKKIKPLNLTWHAAVSSNLVHHKDLILLMRESGCRSLFIGFESINHDSLKSVRKRQNQIDRYQELIRFLHQNGIMINASMVFGFDEDTPNVFSNTLHWLVKNKIETVTAHILTPYPGTELYKRLKAENRITDFNRNHYNTSNVVFRPKRMSAEELKQGYLQIYREFYSYKNIFARMPIGKKRQIPYILFNLGYRKFGKVTSKLGRLGLMNTIGRLARRLSYGIG